MFVIQLIIVLVALYFGARYGGIALGLISGIALAILVFCFGLTPGNPPTDVIYIIMAAIACAAMLQASGGMDWMIQLAEKLLRRHPAHIVFLAPFCSFLLTVCVGTGHVIYALMPIIVDVALKNGIRPERPCAVASIAAQVGIICSPISAAVVSFVAISGDNGFDISIPQVLMIMIPASLIGLFAAALFSRKRGKDLDKDPEFQQKLADPEQRKYIYGDIASTLDTEISWRAKLSVYIFFTAILSIVALAAFGYKAVKMNIVIQIIMLVAAAMMLICCRTSPKKAVQGKAWQSGTTAIIAIYGLAWMADTLFGNYNAEMKDLLGGVIASYPWAIAFVFFAVSVLINSQGATVVAMLPLAYSLGVPGYILLGVLPSVYGYYFIPNYPSDIATVNFDRSGTTKIGKYLLNHSFMVPGLISTVVSVLAGLLLSILFIK